MMSEAFMAGLLSGDLTMFDADQQYSRNVPMP
jgi:hypothetical protein